MDQQARQSNGQAAATTLPGTVQHDVAQVLKDRVSGTVSEAEVREIARAKMQRLTMLSQQLGQRYSPDRVMLDRYQITNDRQRSVVAKVRELRENIGQHITDGRGLIFLGSVGTGKDHMLAYLMYSAAAWGASCRWVSGQEFYGRLRDRMDTKAREEDLMAEFSAPQVLAISDPVPPSGDISDWNVSQLYRLLDRRNRDLRCTWVTVNVNDSKEADAKLSAPVWDRLREDAVVLEFFWASWRTRQ